MASTVRHIRLEDELWERFILLPGKSSTEKLEGLMSNQPTPTSSPDTQRDTSLETLELVRSLPDLAAIRGMLLEVIREARAKPKGDPAPESKYTRPDGKPMTYWERYEVDKAEELQKRASADKTAKAADRADIDYSEPQ